MDKIKSSRSKGQLMAVQKVCKIAILTSRQQPLYVFGLYGRIFLT
jgi:hypothetical protein